MSTREASIPKRQRTFPRAGSLTLVEPSSVPPPEQSLWAIPDVADFLKVTVKAVRCMLQRRLFPEPCLLKIGRRVRFRPELLRTWVLAQRPEGYVSEGHRDAV